MKIVILLILSLHSLASIKTNIVSMEQGKNRSTVDVLVSWNGRVLEASKDNQRILDLLEEARISGLEVNLDIESGAQFDLLNNKEMITEVELLNFEVNNKNKNLTEGTAIAEHPMIGFEPTVVDSSDRANEIFKTLNTKTRRSSQCFNRAHIWSKSMWDNYKIKSMKIFIFYTKKFRSEISDKWWFHVAPMINVAGVNTVMDREFTRTPKTADQWEGIFTGKLNTPGYRCKKMDNISTYFEDENYNNEFCNIQYTSMYHWGPNDLQQAASESIIQTDWKNWKLRESSRQGFKRWRKVYEARKTK
jgi:hypothetical protein